MLTPQLKDWFLRDVPREVCKAMAEMVIEEYGCAAEECEARFMREEAIHTIASIRRGRIETRLLSLRGLFPGLVRVEAVRNKTGNHSHREVYVNDWTVTQSKVEEPNGPIRGADFRETLAVSSQTSLWTPATPEPTPAGVRPWGCLVHMPADSVQDQPGVLRIAFPREDRLWEDYVDLYLWIPELRAHATSEVVMELRREERRRWAA